MKKVLQAVLLLSIFTSFSFAQLGDLDLSMVDKDVVKTEFAGFSDGMHAAMSSLEWDEAAAPEVFGISVKVFLAGSGVDAIPLLGIQDDIPVGLIGAQVGFGTMGYEIYVRFLPELETDGADIGMLGFGLKYDLTDLIPIPAMPALSAYASYNSLSFGVTRDIDNPVLQNQKIKTGISTDFSTINFGIITGYDLIILSVYGKAGLEIGTTELSWDAVDGATGAKTNESITLDTTSFRYAAGLSLFGIKAEIGGRGSNIAYAIGYGISF